MSFPWFRAPEGMHLLPTDEQLAWVLLLSSWHQGQPVGHRVLRAATGWGGSRADRFLEAAQRWAADNGARIPDQHRGNAGAEPGQRRGRAGAVDKPQKPTIEAKRGSTGADPGQIRGSAGAAHQDSSPTRPASEAPKTKTKTQIEDLSLSPAGQPAPPPAGERADLLSRLIGEKLAAAVATVGCFTPEQLAALPDDQIRFLKGVGVPGLAQIRRALDAAGVRSAPPVTQPTSPASAPVKDRSLFRTSPRPTSRSADGNA